MSSRKIIICGPGEAGKDFIANAISKIFNLRYSYGTSWYAKEECLAKAMAHSDHGNNPYTDTGAMTSIVGETPVSWWKRRREFRKFWVKAIAEINAKDPSTLYRKCYEENDILTGIRRLDELQAAYSIYDMTLSIFVNREEEGAIDIGDDKSMEFTRSACDIAVVNFNDEKEWTIFNLIKTLTYMGFQYRHQSYCGEKYYGEATTRNTND